MADDFNVDDLLEAPFQQKNENGKAEKSGSDSDGGHKKKKRRCTGYFL